MFGFWCALLATLACQPALAVDGVPFDNKPLQSGSSIPPNIMFILDNSGSMALVSMPFDVQDPQYTGTNTGAGQTGLNDNPHDRSYLNNTIYYNPNLQYNPWMTSDGTTRMTGGMNATQVYKDWNLASNGNGTRDLRDNSESIFYVPKTGVTSSTDPNDFVRYRINSSGQVVRNNETTSVPAGYPMTGLSTTNNNNHDYALTVPSGISVITVTTSGGTGNARLYLFDPSGNQQCTSASSSGNDESCSYSASPVANGNWTVRLKRQTNNNSSNYSGVTLTVTFTSISEALATPTGRAQADELTNIATWYSYYRTRIKTAKGGASEAFSNMTRDARVGYTPINGRSPDLSATGTGAIIPVNTNGGLFETANKSAWFTSVQGETVQAGSTPLRTTLNAVGNYYTRSDANGPWGPSTGTNQLSCRQSFSILTTDGYWNDSSSTTFSLGDEDSDGHSVTLADVAMHFYNTDLRDLTNNVRTTTSDPANWQHMVTFSISIGLSGTLPITDPPPASNAAIWPDPMDAEDEERIDDLWHAAVNGHGKFVAANNPTQFASALQAALASIQEQNASSSNVAATSSTLAAGEQIFYAKYVGGLWTGEVAAQPLVGTTPTAWTTNTAGLIPAAASRKIYAWGTAKGTFTWANLTSAQQTALGGATLGPNVLNYLRGDQSGEGTTADKFRQRAHLLGDVVDSSPVFESETTPKMVYVGANDGMLHGFNATTGAEVFAYVPKGIDYSKLKTLSDQTYSHQYFVDGPLTVSDRATTPGKNILIGTLGRGGKTIYALDVSNPSTFGTAATMLWEKSSADYPLLGNVSGAPIIVKLNVKKADGVTNKVGVIVGNGYNSSTGHSAILILDIEDGSLIKSFDTGVGGTATEADGNGMAAPSVWDVNRSGTADYVYAGDLKGNIWKFDINSSTVSDWGNKLTGNAALFHVDGQPITGGISIGLDPTTFKRWIFFGTGRYLTPADPANRSQQGWYGIIDDDAAVAIADMQSRAIAVDASGTRTFPANGTLDVTKKGWYVNLSIPSNTSEGSERILTQPLLDGRFLAVSSAIPGNTACSPGGRGYLNLIDPFTGTALATPVVDVNGDGTPDNVGSVSYDSGMPSAPVVVYAPGGTGKIIVQTGDGSIPDQKDLYFGTVPGRISWREIIRN